MKTIGFIGLGHMGNPMAKNLLKNNDRVIVFDLSQTAMTDLTACGAVAANSPADAAKEADIIFTMLQTGEQVKQCCLGEKGIFSHLKKEALYIDSSTIDINSTRTLHTAAKQHQIIMLDAPVSGGVLAAKNATLTFMVGGEQKQYERARPLLSTLGGKIIYAGNAGSGVAAKICNNMILGVSMIAVSEAFALANQLGLDPQKLFDISTNASGQCWSLSQYCPWPNILPNVPSSHDYQPGFTAKMMLKDLHLSQEAAALSQVETPLGQQAMALYEKFVASKAEDIDFSAIIKLFLCTRTQSI